MPQSMSLLVQESMATAARVRRGERVSNAELFRNKLIESLQRVEEKARAAGYTAKDTKLAIFAVTAIIDEIVLASGEPVFAQWHRQPLCLQVFATNLGGELFFDNTHLLLQRGADPHAADVLEVYLLCLLLGFAGKYKNNNAPESDI